MKKTKEIFNEVYNDLVKERGIATLSDEPRTLDEIEEMVDGFGRDFERIIKERLLNEQREKVDKKKAVKNVGENSRTLG